VKYQNTPPGVGLLEVEYVKADGQEHKERCCWDCIGTEYDTVNITAPTLTLVQYFIRFCCCPKLTILTEFLVKIY
jgi:hypothetical protein